MNYFLANKELDYLRGYGEGAVYRNNRMEKKDDADKAAFFSRVFDSRLEGTAWHRFTADIIEDGTVMIKFSIYASDLDYIVQHGEKIQLDKYIKDADISLEDKIKTLEPLLKKKIVNCRDMLLFDVKGRYMFYLCEMYSRENIEPYVGDVTLFFPRKTWTDFLPDLYATAAAANDFSDRFLAIFQSVYEDMDQKIKESYRLLDPKQADRPMLEELAGWFGFRNLYLWSDEKLKELVLRAHELISEKGTVKGLEDMLEIYLGERPEVIECFKIAQSDDVAAQLEYGTDKYRYVVNVKDKYISSTKDYNALLCIIEGSNPAHMKVRIRPVIEPGVTSSNAYLGINTGIGTEDKEALL